MVLDYTSNTSSGLPFTQMVLEDFTPELQWSADFSIFVVLEGTLSVNYKNHTRELNAYDMFFFAPFETYSIISATKNASLLNISIDSSYIRKLCPDVESLEMQQSHITKNMGNQVYINLCKYFAIIIFNNLKTETCSKLKLLDAANGMLITIFEAYGVKSDDALMGKGYVLDRVSDIMKYINDHYSEKITVADISSSLGIHPQYFSTFFTKHFSTSFVEYLTSFRINQSMERLIYSNDSILDIAIACGFSNHKTYSAAFKKIYDMTPTDYRKNQANNSGFNESEINPLISNDPALDDSAFGAFAYFRQFLDLDNTSSFSIKKTSSLNLNSREFTSNSMIVNQESFMSVGRAYACLRSDVQKQLLAAHDDLNFTHLRIRDIFSDDMYIYYEDANHKPTYSWQTLDTVFDFLIENGMKPFPEIGFMPEQLASKKQYAGWQFRPNVSAPKSMERWQELVRNFLTHYIDRYGLPEVRSWYFDFWTCPDIQIKPAYWNESMQAFFEFYKATYDVFKEVHRDLRLGTPNFSTINGHDWYDAFFVFCKKYDIHPAYLSIHLYGCAPKTGEDTNESYDSVDYSTFTTSNQNYIEEYLTKLRELMNFHNLPNMDIIVSDWNLTFLPKDYVRDTCYMGTYIAHTYINTISQVKGLCFWSLSDIHEEYFPENTLFHGGPGMVDYHGLRKASYNTYVLINKLGTNILDRGCNYIFIKKGPCFQLLIYNMAEFDEIYELMDMTTIDSTHRYNIYKNTEELNLNIMIEMPAGTYYIKKYEVNRKYGSSYDMWSDMGFPKELPKDMEDYIREASVPHVSYQLQDVETTLILDEAIPSHGVVLLEITKR